MARTKQTARKIYPDQGLDRPSSSRTSGKSLPSLRATMKNRRYEINRSVLLELKKLQKHVSLAIPKLPFQRLVRDICEQNKLQFRWSTLMPRDFNSLRLLRFKYDKTLVPVGISDRKMDNILNIPPLGKVKVTDLSRTAHQYGTCLNVELESLRENEELDFQIEEKERIATEQREHKMAEAHHEANAEDLQCLYPFYGSKIGSYQI
ncbi:hypothetical protein L7F22_046701 [Adiantum nelumboides]|nr:hypothetical protein [Adiantum nelumboides]